MIGKNIEKLIPGEFVFIPKGKKHRLKNMSKKNMILIEVQIGKYLEEDDIIRYE